MSASCYTKKLTNYKFDGEKKLFLAGKISQCDSAQQLLRLICGSKNHLI
jgi:hypothetical protein